jgi:hypothetical protein
MISIISIFHLSSPPAIPTVTCIAWNFDGSNVVTMFGGKNEDLNQLKFENGDIIPNAVNYFYLD